MIFIYTCMGISSRQLVINYDKYTSDSVILTHHVYQQYIVIYHTSQWGLYLISVMKPIGNIYQLIITILNYMIIDCSLLVKCIYQLIVTFMLQPRDKIYVLYCYSFIIILVNNLSKNNCTCYQQNQIAIPATLQFTIQ